MTEKKMTEKIQAYHMIVCARCPHKKLCDSLPEDVSCETVWKLANLPESNDGEGE